MIVIAYVLGVLTVPTVALLVLVARGMPSAARQVRHEQQVGIPLCRTSLRRWAWWVFVAGRQRVANEIYERDWAMPLFRSRWHAWSWVLAHRTR